MEVKELIEKGLQDIKTQVEEKTKGLDGLEAKTAQLIADAEVKLKEANQAEIKTITDDFNKRIDAVVAEVKAKQVTNTKEVKTFRAEFSKAIEEKADAIKTLGAGRSVSMELKDLTINTNNSLNDGLANEAGGAVITQGGAVILPSQKVNFSDLIATVTGTNDTIQFWREVAGTNAFDYVNKGNAKPEQALETEPIVFTASYLAGLYAYHKSMNRNLPWMQQRLPQMLTRNFYKKENQVFYDALKADATPYAGTETGLVALVESIAQLENADFDANGILVNPADFADISVTRDDNNQFTLPGTVVFSNGRLTINGVPVFKASFVPIGEAIVGDWSKAYKYVTDGLKIELFEQDDKNVQKNAITARVEESNVLVVEQPLAFIKVDIAGA